MAGDVSSPGAVQTGTKGTPFGDMGGKINNPASYSGGAGKGGGMGGITPQSPNPYMPTTLGSSRFGGPFQVPRIQTGFTNYQAPPMGLNLGHTPVAQAPQGGLLGDVYNFVRQQIPPPYNPGNEGP